MSASSTKVLPGTARLLLVRHGETTWNVQRRYQGHLDSPLTEKGVRQMEALAERLRNYSFVAIYSSDLGRAVQSAQIVAARTGHKVQVDARLRERSLGIFQGLSREEIKSQFPAEYKAYRGRAPGYVVPQGESARQRYECHIQCFEELAKKHHGEVFLVIAHGGALQSLFRHAVGISLEAARRFALTNGALNQFLSENGKWILEVWGLEFTS